MFGNPKNRGQFLGNLKYNARMESETLRSWAEPLWDRFLKLPSNFGLIGGTIDTEVTLYGQEFDRVAALFPLSEFQGLKHFFLFTLFLECHEVNLLHGWEIEFVARPFEEALNEMALWPGEPISAQELLVQLNEQGYPWEAVIGWISERHLEECRAFGVGDERSYIARCRDGYVSVFVR